MGKVIGKEVISAEERVKQLESMMQNYAQENHRLKLLLNEKGATVKLDYLFRILHTKESFDKEDIKRVTKEIVEILLGDSEKEASSTEDKK
jgi:hypothetical protein